MNSDVASVMIGSQVISFDGMTPLCQTSSNSDVFGSSSFNKNC